MIPQLYQEFRSIEEINIHRQKKELLNNDFYSNGRVIDSLSVIYFPQKEGIFTEMQLLFEGNHYAMPHHRALENFYLGRLEERSFDAYLKSLRCNNTPETFVRIGISLSPNQINAIRRAISHYSPNRKTNERFVAHFLQTFTNLNIPLLLTQWNNTAATTYLCIQKKLGNRNIGIIRIEENRVRVLKRSTELCCVGFDCFVYTVIAANFAAIGLLLLYISFFQSKEPKINRISGYLC